MNPIRSAILLLLITLFAPLLAQAQVESAPGDSLDRNYAGELPRIAPLKPAEALKSFEIHPDFRIELAAAEPLVRDPIAMAFDAAGRLYVVEMRGYSEQRDENLGEVRRLEDTDGDGVFDKATTYVDGLAWPTAVACWDGGVFVGAAPDVLYCKDTDGDGRADVREVVYTGFGLANVQGLLNTFLWGLDNRIHGATSSSGADVQRPDAPWTTPVTLRNRDFAFDPRTRDLSPTSGGGQHGMSFDAWGRKFVCSNSDHCQLIMFEDHYLAHNPWVEAPSPRVSIAEDGPAADVFRISPVEPWRLVRTRLRVQGLVPGPIEGGGTAAGYFTSATGITIYKGDAWPEEYRGQVFIGDVGGNLVHRKTLHADGAGLIARRADEGTEFLRSTDIWFRPVQFANGPDGALYIADMYREVIEHPDSLPPIIKQHLDLTSGHDRGRIYRVVPKNFEQPVIPDLSAYETAALVPLLAHENAWHRETASRLLYERQDRAAVGALRTMVRAGGAPLGRIHALYILHGLDALVTDDVNAVAKADLPALRRHGAKLGEVFPDDEQIVDMYRDLSQDSDVIVRYQTAYSAGILPADVRAGIVASIAQENSSDKWVNMAIVTSSHGVAHEVFAALLPDYLEEGSHGDLFRELAYHVGASSPVDGISRAVAELDRFDEDGANTVVSAMLQGITVAGRDAAAARALRENEQGARAIRALVARGEAAVPDTEMPLTRRADAIGALAFAPPDLAVKHLTALLTATQPDALQRAAIETLGRLEGIEAATALVDHWDGLAPAARSEALEMLSARPERVAIFLDAIEAETISTNQVSSTRIAQLRNHPTEEIGSRARAIFQRADRQDREELIEEFRSRIKEFWKYDAVAGIRGFQGRGLFEANCAQCHRAHGLGHAVGPDLATVAQNGWEKILVNVLDPNREVNPQYTYYIVETKDGESHTGLITGETAANITLLRAHGERETIPREQIEKVTSSSLSLMPEDWEYSLQATDLANIIRFLLSGEFPEAAPKHLPD